MSARLSLAASLALASCGARAAPTAPPGAPNVLILTIDTLRADRLGLYGYARPTSPELDRFAASAVVFENAQASAPWTLPSLASLLTGEDPGTHLCREFGSVLDESFVTLPERLLAAGYDTAGVTSHVFTTTRHGLQQGFVHTDDSFAYPEVEPARNISSQVISDKGIRFLEQKRAASDGTPWLLWLHYFDPHEEYMPHPELADLFPPEAGAAPGVSELYDAEVRYTDQHVGRVLAKLTEAGFDDNTLVLVLADHGEELLERGGLGHGHSLHQELLRVPFLLRAPGIAPRRVSTTVRQIDVPATVLELAGLPPESGVGRSLVPLMRGEALEEAGAVSELARGPRQLDALRLGAWKLIQERKGGGFELYDVNADPREQEDLAATHPAEVARLRVELERLQAQARERTARYAMTQALSFTPAVEADLESLGYSGEQEPAGKDAR
jgi:arylsulfatase A-like enzyme